MNNQQKIRISIVLLVVLASIVAVVKKPLTLGLDLQGGMQVILEAQDTDTVKANRDAVLGAMAVIRNRIYELGVEPTIRKKGERQIFIELPGIKDPERALRLIGETALLEFVEADWAPSGADNLTPEQLRIMAGPNAKLDVYREMDPQGNVISERHIFLRKTVLTGKDLRVVSPDTDQYNSPIVSIEFTKEAGKVFYTVTSRHQGRPLAILLDGRIISAPNINEAIAGGRAQISGQFSIEEMRDLVIKLKGGSLPVPVETVSRKIVGPTLGADSIEKSKVAGLMGLGIICLIMLIFYQIPGILACFALMIYLLVFIATLKLTGATLTLPGIAGMILTMGMALDANVIIFERIKEEKRSGQTMRGAIESGFARAFITIVDANVTTLIAAAVLFFLGTATIKGFAVTLSFGILISMFSAIMVTRLFVRGVAGMVSPEKGLFIRT